MDPNLQVMIIVGSVIGAFLWLRQDIKRVEDKADKSNKQILEIQGDMKVLTAALQRIEGWFNPPTLKSTDRESKPRE